MQPKSSTRIHIVSDLHLSLQDWTPPAVEADVTVLAGDIARPDAAMRWASQLPPPVLYVPGNHEFYGGKVPEVRAKLAESAARYGIHLLDQGEAIVRGVRFLGTTLWTDFELFGIGHRDTAMERVAAFSYDFTKIRNGDGSRFTPADSIALFREQHAWLNAALSRAFAGPTVVITHHAPSALSVPRRYADALTSAGFASDCSALLGRQALWVHGHMHETFDYTTQGTRVVCNPRGYFRNGAAENLAFDPTFCVDVPVPA